jgi:hypothetical protein
MRAEQDHLAHVDENNRNHEIRSPTVHGTEEPTQGRNMIEVL